MSDWANVAGALGYILEDHAFAAYIVGLLVSVYGFGLFAAYWVSRGRASFVYFCVTLLLAGLATQYAANAYTRWNYLHGNTAPLCSAWWPFRIYFTLIAVTMLSVGMTLRWINSKRHKSGAVGDRRKSYPNDRRTGPADRRTGPADRRSRGGKL